MWKEMFRTTVEIIWIFLKEVGSLFIETYPLSWGLYTVCFTILVVIAYILRPNPEILLELTKPFTLQTIIESAIISFVWATIAVLLLWDELINRR